MPTLFEVLRQPHLRAAVFRSVCCPPQLAFAGLLGSNKEASAWRSTLCDPSALCQHALLHPDILIMLASDRNPLLTARCASRSPDEFDCITVAQQPDNHLPVASALLSSALAKGQPCHATIYTWRERTDPRELLESVARLRRQYGTRLRVTVVCERWGAVHGAQAKFPGSAIAVSDLTQLLPQQEQRLVGCDRAALRGVLFFGLGTYLWQQ
jgi:hypothetical protein